jgi:hypothetical protein
LANGTSRDKSDDADGESAKRYRDIFFWPKPVSEVAQTASAYNPRESVL